jgi:hypothetical protein
MPTISRPITVTRSGRQITVESSLTLDEAARIAGQLPGSFPQSLAGQYESLVARKNAGRFSDKQCDWLIYLAQEKVDGDARLAEATARPGPAKSGPPARSVDLSAIVAIFRSAAFHQARPKVRLTTKEGSRVVMTAAGSSSAHFGKIRVTDGSAFGSGGRFWGWISPDGSTTVIDPDVLALLADFAVNPAEIAGEHGRTHGNCCFCGRDLTDVRSTTVGYGPICADHYGLEWGTGKVATADGSAVKVNECELVAV